MVASGHRPLIARAAAIAVRTSWSLNQPGCCRTDPREIAVVHRPRQEVDFIERADERRPAADRLVLLERGERESGEPLRKVRRGLVDAIGRAVVEQVPDHLEPDALGRFQRRQPARPVILAGRLLDQMPAQAIADGAETELLAQPVVAQHVPVVARRANEVEPNAVAPPVRRTFEPGLEEAGEMIAHGPQQCARNEMEPNPVLRHNLEDHAFLRLEEP